MSPQMTYIECRGAGGVEVMQRAQGARPVPEPGEVLIRVSAAGVNRPDVLQRQGAYPPPKDASPVLGLEVAGEVCALGTGVTQWRLGDKVCALVNGGGYASYVCAPAGQCLPIPSGLDAVQAAALPETLFTVWHNLWQRAGLKKGETLLVHGGSSGIGTTAIQLARAFGVTPYVTAGSDEKCRACERLGAAQAINYTQTDYVAEVKRLTDRKGVQVILDMVGGDYIQRNLSAAAVEGRIVNIAYLKGSKVTVDFLPLMLKRLTLTGSTLRAQSAEVKSAIASDLKTHVWPLIEQGKIRPVIHRTFPMHEAAEAHQLMESGRLIGKTVLTLNRE